MSNHALAITFIEDLKQLHGELPTILLVASVTVALALLASHLLVRLLHKQLKERNVGAVSLLANLVRAVIAVVVVFFLGENLFNVEMSGVVQALGVTTLVVSLGLQDLIKSVVAGMLVVAGNIVAVGDQVMLGDHRGEVMDINWHQITIRDRDGVPHIIPNSELMSDSFMRMTGKMACRHIFECDIAPGVNLALVKTDIETLAANVLTKNGWIAPGHMPQVLFLGSSALGTNASVRVFISDIEYATRAMDAVMIAISERGYLADVTHEVDASWKRGLDSDDQSLAREG
ncbi:MAG: mechanosensitive ion channel [Coriobacteriales bacterium]|nr:mechanosensitive ion channel [Coriobacteriales bacterium]